MHPDSHGHVHTGDEFLAKDEFSVLDPDLFSGESAQDILKRREAIIKRYVDVRKLAQVASGLGDKGLSQF